MRGGAEAEPTEQRSCSCSPEPQPLGRCQRWMDLESQPTCKRFVRVGTASGGAEWTPVLCRISPLSQEGAQDKTSARARICVRSCKAEYFSFGVWTGRGTQYVRLSVWV